ncbi:MAG: outer membrane protein assembly factor BamA, partial [Bdellovibrio sp.]|nr:outer membrane protein assembly factor BamA [Bdellovibrio sp.]
MIKLLSTLLLVTATSTVMAAPKKKTPAKKSAAAAVESTSEVPSGIKIKAIEVAGNRKIEKDAIITKITSKVGDDYSSAHVREDVESLFKLGYFNNIEVDRQISGKEAVLTYKVLEKPSIVEITYEGNSEIKAED